MTPAAGIAPSSAVIVMLFLLSGCSTIVHVPTQNILMFSADGKLVDPTGNLDCMKEASPAGPLCHEPKAAEGRATHVGAVGYTELEDHYYENTYLLRLFECVRGYFQSSPASPPGQACRQKPELAPRPAATTGPKRLLIFVHGGLNTEIDSIERVVSRAKAEEELYNRIARAGHYPIFINWRASFTSNYFDGLVNIRQGEKKPILGPATAPTVFVIDVMRGITRAPLVWSAQSVNDLKTTPGFSFLDSRDPDIVATQLICAYEYADPETCQKTFRFKEPPFCTPFNVRSQEKLDGKRNFKKRPSPNPDTLAISVGEDLRTCPEMDISFLSYLVTLPSRLLLDPVVDSFGTSAWETMLRRTRLLFNRDDEFSHPRPEHEEEGGEALAEIPRRGGISIFLRRLEKEIRKDGHGWEITLVGHSMGAIIVNQILREAIALRLRLPITTIVYMAAAASVRDVLDSVVPYLRKTPDAKFYNLTLHPIAEERESYKLGDIPLDPGPRGSLLVMIDNFLSKPPTYLDRTAGRYQNFLPAVHNIPRDLWPRVHVKVFSVGDSEAVRTANPQRHGDFTTRFKFWNPDCWESEPKMEKIHVDPRACIYDPSE